MHAAVSGVGRSKASRTIAAPVTSWRAVSSLVTTTVAMPGGQGRAQPGPGVLDRHRPVGVQTEARQREQVGRGVGLEIGDVVPADRRPRRCPAPIRCASSGSTHARRPVVATAIRTPWERRSSRSSGTPGRGIDLPAPDDVDEQLGLRPVHARGDLVGLGRRDALPAQRVRRPAAVRRSPPAARGSARRPSAGRRRAAAKASLNATRCPSRSVSARVPSTSKTTAAGRCHGVHRAASVRW